MNAKKIDKIAIGTLYVIAGIIVTILAALISVIKLITKERGKKNYAR